MNGRGRAGRNQPERRKLLKRRTPLGIDIKANFELACNARGGFMNRENECRRGDEAFLALPDGQLPGEGRLDVGKVGGQDGVPHATLHHGEQVHRSCSGNVRGVVLEENVQHLRL